MHPKAHISLSVSGGTICRSRVCVCTVLGTYSRVCRCWCWRGRFFRRVLWRCRSLRVWLYRLRWRCLVFWCLGVVCVCRACRRWRVRFVWPNRWFWVLLVFCRAGVIFVRWWVGWGHRRSRIPWWCWVLVLRWWTRGRRRCWRVWTIRVVWLRWRCFLFVLWFCWWVIFFWWRSFCLRRGGGRGRRCRRR